MQMQIDITKLDVASQLDWRIEFGLWLRNTPSQKKKKRSGLSLEAYERDIKLMAAWFEEKYAMTFEPCQMNIQNVGEYFALFENAPATHKRKLASLRLLIRWGMDAELIDHDPSAWIAYVDVVRKSPRDLNDEERKKMELAAEAGESTLLGLRDSVIFFLMNDAGLRISEVVNLKIADVDLDTGIILDMLGKGGKRRDVYLPSRLVTKVRTWLDRGPDSVEGTLITDENGLSIGRGQTWRRFVLIADTAGVNCTPHSMRHTYIYRLKRAYKTIFPFVTEDEISMSASYQTGDDVEVIRSYYTGVRDSNLRAAVEAM